MSGSKTGSKNNETSSSSVRFRYCKIGIIDSACRILRLWVATRNSARRIGISNSRQEILHAELSISNSGQEILHAEFRISNSRQGILHAELFISNLRQKNLHAEWFLPSGGKEFCVQNAILRFFTWQFRSSPPRRT